MCEKGCDRRRVSLVGAGRREFASGQKGALNPWVGQTGSECRTCSGNLVRHARSGLQSMGAASQTRKHRATVQEAGCEGGGGGKHRSWESESGEQEAGMAGRGRENKQDGSRAKKMETQGGGGKENNLWVHNVRILEGRGEGAVQEERRALGSEASGNRGKRWLKEAAAAKQATRNAKKKFKMEGCKRHEPGKGGQA